MSIPDIIRSHAGEITKTLQELCTTGDIIFANKPDGGEEGDDAFIYNLRVHATAEHAWVKKIKKAFSAKGITPKHIQAALDAGFDQPTDDALVLAWVTKFC